VAKTVEEKWREVESYYDAIFVKEDGALAAAMAESEKAGLPGIEVTGAQGKLLQFLVRMSGAKQVLEVGTLGGYSAIWMGRGLPAGGKMISLELSPKHAELARKNLARAGLSDVVEVREGRAMDSLEALSREGAVFDFVFIDADKASTADYFACALKMAHPGTVIVVDNVVREGEIVNPGSADDGVAGIRRFNELAAKEKRVSGTVMQTVSSKGYDGLAVMVVS